MIKLLPMTGSEQRIDDLLDGMSNLANPDLDPSNITEAYWRGRQPQIMFENPQDNNNIIYIAENSGDPADKQYPLYPGRSVTLDFSEFVKARNIFYVTWSLGDTLSIMVR